MAWYRTGTIDVTNGSTAVTGTGTAWRANALIGNAIRLPDGSYGEIAAIGSDTSITLAVPYGGATASGQSYQIMPNAGFAQYARDLVQQFLTTYQGFTTTALAGRFPDGSAAAPGLSWSADPDTGFYRKGSNTIGFASGGGDVVEFGGTTVLYADASASAVNLVGRAADGAAYLQWLNAGRTAVRGYVAVAPNGQFVTSSPDHHVAYVPAGKSFYWNQAGTGLLQLGATTLAPQADNALSCGAASVRFTSIYAATGAIQTSDERLKQWRGGLTDDELAAAKEIAGTIGIYQFLADIADKGVAAARLHVGVRAQATAAIFRAHNLDPDRYGINCYDKWDAVAATPDVPAIPARPEVRDNDGRLVSPADPGRPAIPGSPASPAGDRYSIRYDELTMFLLATREQRLGVIEAKLAAQEQRLGVIEAKLAA